MFPSYLEVEKTGSQLFRVCQTLLQLFVERKKWIPAIWRPKNVVVRKTGSNKCFPALWKCKKLVPSYFEPDKYCCSYLEREKSGSLLFEDQKCSLQLLGARKKIMTSI